MTQICQWQKISHEQTATPTTNGKCSASYMGRRLVRSKQSLIHESKHASILATDELGWKFVTLVVPFDSSCTLASENVNDESSILTECEENCSVPGSLGCWPLIGGSWRSHFHFQGGPPPQLWKSIKAARRADCSETLFCTVCWLVLSQDWKAISQCITVLKDEMYTLFA